MSNYKRYSWNRNAATNERAITRFAMMAFLMSFTAPASILLATMGSTPESTPEIRYIAMAMICGHGTLFAMILAVMVAMYWQLNEQHANRPTPPTPPTKASPGDVESTIQVNKNGKQANYEIVARRKK
jgi:hypothetical protein